MDIFFQISCSILQDRSSNFISIIVHQKYRGLLKLCTERNRKDKLKLLAKLLYKRMISEQNAVGGIFFYDREDGTESHTVEKSSFTFLCLTHFMAIWFCNSMILYGVFEVFFAATYIFAISYCPWKTQNLIACKNKLFFSTLLLK